MSERKEVGNTYFVYAYLVSGLWALRYARKVSRNLGLGLLTMALGLIGLTITSVNLMILMALRIDEPGSHEPFNAVNLFSWTKAAGKTCLLE